MGVLRGNSILRRVTELGLPVQVLQPIIMELGLPVEVFQPILGFTTHFRVHGESVFQQQQQQHAAACSSKQQAQKRSFWEHRSAKLASKELKTTVQQMHIT